MSPKLRKVSELETFRISLTHRLRFAVGGHTYADVARIVGCSAESVRRYLQGHIPSLEFVYAFCAKLNISPTWLILGIGPFHLDEDDRQLALSAPAAAPDLPLKPLFERGGPHAMESKPTRRKSVAGPRR